MGRKCSVFGCTSGYVGKNKSQDPADKVPVYKFPDDEEECRQWVVCLPNKKTKKITKFMGICALHWPADTPLVRKNRGRYPSPVCPPSIFPNVPASCIPSHTSSTPRPTKKSLTSARNLEVDEMQAFKEQDTIKSDSFEVHLTDTFSDVGFMSFKDENCVLLSKDRSVCVHTFSVYLCIQTPDTASTSASITVTYEAYYGLKRIFHPSLQNDLKYWSQLEELIRFVRNFSLDEDDLQLKFLYEATQRYNSAKNSRIYSVEDFCLAFSWYAKSRALYQELRDHIKLPSLSTLRKITSVAKNLDDMSLFKSVFSAIDERSRGCILIIDEVYVKASLTYRGGTVFGYAQDDPEKLATTFLCIMVKCFFGSKSFLVKLIPCHALASQFQFTAVCDTILSLEKCGVQVLALICDNNRVNQRFFSLFEPQDQTYPWIVNSPAAPTRPLFLIFDPVHILKNIRNSWITEKTQRICFTQDGVVKTAMWSDLKQLYHHDSTLQLPLSSLTKAAVQPNNIEKQKVSLALQVFSEKTSAALKTSDITKHSESCQQTASFIDEVLRLWKVFNCKTPLQCIHQRDPDRAAVDSTAQGNRQIETLLAWAETAKDMEPKSNPRICKLTRDTSKAIQWTCRCLVALCQHLLQTDAPYAHQYVTLGFFQQDDIERHFAHFRMSAGNNFFISAQDIMNTHAIDKTKLMLEYDSSGHIDHKNAHHVCKLCDIPLSDSEMLIVDDLPEQLDNISKDEKMSLFHIGGYICQKHPEHPKYEGDPSLYSDLVSSYTDQLNRGGLFFPSRELLQFLCYVYLFFTNTNSSRKQSCRKRLIKIFMDFPSLFHLDITLSSTVLTRIVNIMLKRFCTKNTNENEQNKKRKVAKLSSTSQSQ